jgi:23S rRNA (adenine2503-C2)-methyltransferase
MDIYGLQPFRGNQLFQWLWQKGVCDFESMTNISKQLRIRFAHDFDIRTLRVQRIEKAQDGAQKFLFQTDDGHHIEAVFIPDKKRRTVCISTQIGCPLGCQFCATGRMGLKRNLSAHEIAEQVQLIRHTTRESITNVVFMGMGEPLLNLDEVLSAIEIISSPIGLSISQRHMTISTVGINQGIRKLLESSYKGKLAISLNFADETLRVRMMPVTQHNPFSELLPLARLFSQRKTRVTFEYVLIHALNDDIKEAQRLVRLLAHIPSKINLIPYNPCPGIPFQRPSIESIERFYHALLDSPHTVTVRQSKGTVILAACGQLVDHRHVDSETS